MHSEPFMNPVIHPEDGALDVRIVHALEQSPRVQIPADFAARVAFRIPARASRLRTAHVAAYSVKARRVGMTIATACLIALAVAMVALAPRTAHDTFYIALEWTMAAQFCLLATWLAMPRKQ